MARIPAVTVLGLGRFGTALARELAESRVEVIGIDSDEKLVAECSPYLSNCAVADTTDPVALEQLGVHEAKRVVVGIGTHLESSILTVSNVVEFGVPDIWAKADSLAHAKILRRLGVHHVIRPEADTGRRIAHLLTGPMEDFVELDDRFGFTTTRLRSEADPEWVWKRYKVQIVSQRDTEWTPVVPGRTIPEGTRVILAGSPGALDKFANR